MNEKQNRLFSYLTTVTKSHNNLLITTSLYGGITMIDRETIVKCIQDPMEQYQQKMMNTFNKQIIHYTEKKENQKYGRR